MQPVIASGEVAGESGRRSPSGGASLSAEERGGDRSVVRVLAGENLIEHDARREESAFSVGEPPEASSGARYGRGSPSRGYHQSEVFHQASPSGITWMLTGSTSPWQDPLLVARREGLQDAERTLTCFLERVALLHPVGEGDAWDEVGHDVDAIPSVPKS